MTKIIIICISLFCGNVLATKMAPNTRAEELRLFEANVERLNIKTWSDGNIKDRLTTKIPPGGLTQKTEAVSGAIEERLTQYLEILNETGEWDNGSASLEIADAARARIIITENVLKIFRCNLSEMTIAEFSLASKILGIIISQYPDDRAASRDIIVYMIATLGEVDIERRTILLKWLEFGYANNIKIAHGSTVGTPSGLNYTLEFTLAKLFDPVNYKIRKGMNNLLQLEQLHLQQNLNPIDCMLNTDGKIALLRIIIHTLVQPSHHNNCTENPFITVRYMMKKVIESIKHDVKTADNETAVKIRERLWSAMRMRMCSDMTLRENSVNLSGLEYACNDLVTLIKPLPGELVREDDVEMALKQLLTSTIMARSVVSGGAVGTPEKYIINTLKLILGLSNERINIKHSIVVAEILIQLQLLMGQLNSKSDIDIVDLFGLESDTHIKIQYQLDLFNKKFCMQTHRQCQMEFLKEELYSSLYTKYEAKTHYAGFGSQAFEKQNCALKKKQEEIDKLNEELYTTGRLHPSIIEKIQKEILDLERSVRQQQEEELFGREPNIQARRRHQVDLLNKELALSKKKQIQMQPENYSELERRKDYIDKKSLTERMSMNEALDSIIEAIKLQISMKPQILHQIDIFQQEFSAQFREEFSTQPKIPHQIADHLFDIKNEEVDVQPKLQPYIADHLLSQDKLNVTDELSMYDAVCKAVQRRLFPCDDVLKPRDLDYMLCLDIRSPLGSSLWSHSHSPLNYYDKEQLFKMIEVVDLIVDCQLDLAEKWEKKFFAKAREFKNTNLDKLLDKIQGQIFFVKRQIEIEPRIHHEVKIERRMHPEHDLQRGTEAE